MNRRKFDKSSIAAFTLAIASCLGLKAKERTLPFAIRKINNPNLNYNLIIHPEDRTGVWESVNQQISLGEEFKLIYRINTRKGETKIVQEHGRAIFSSTRELLALEGFITEIPNQRFNVNSLKSIPY